MAPLIGIAGRKRSGKDTLARFLVEDYGYARYAFADALKRTALEVNPRVRGYQRLASLVQAVGWEAAKEEPEVRRVLQTLGVAIRRLDPDFWINTVREEIRRALEDGTPVVVTDVRFPNEAETLRELGGYIVRLDRPSATGPGDGHESETSVEGIRADTRISNDGTLSDLRGRARILLADSAREAS